MYIVRSLYPLLQRLQSSLSLKAIIINHEDEDVVLSKPESESNTSTSTMGGGSTVTTDLDLNLKDSESNASAPDADTNSSTKAGAKSESISISPADSASDPDSDSDSDSTIPYQQTEVRVTFFPSLNETRRAWILKKLREERVSSVLDVGCGAGTLLACLCYPPAFLNASNETANSNLNQHHSSSNTNDTGKLPDLHITQLAGLDISTRALEKAIINTTSPTASHYPNMLRWERLEVKLWLGSLQVYNPEFKDVECIVSSEVIEHLPASLLSTYAPMLLGLYRPRVLLITTPNYAFNPRFSAPGTVDPSGFKDPTGRTDRVFRHADHKFEWTPSEFKTWCTDAAATWGYTVEVDAVGQPMEQDPWNRDEELGSASQVALFRRNDDWQGHRPAPAPLTQKSTHKTHKLLETHIHHPHPQAGIPESPEKILENVIKYMESYYLEDGYSVWDLWVENKISIACGGRLDILLNAIDSSPELRLTRNDGTLAREWNVKFSGARHWEAAETSKTSYWERSASHEPPSWSHRVIALDKDADADDITDWPGPSQEWYSLESQGPLVDEEEKFSYSTDAWGAASIHPAFIDVLGWR